MIDLRLPVVFIHVPKCAGSAVRKVIRQSMGKGCRLHYVDETLSRLPDPVSEDYARSFIQKEGRFLVYGHFNRNRGFGVEHSVPWATQFMTVLRDPFEQHVSLFKYKNKNRDVKKHELRDFIAESPTNYLAHFPDVVTPNNFEYVVEEKFNYVGFHDALDRSLDEIFGLLKIDAPEGVVPRVNVSPGLPFEYESYREDFESKNRLLVQVYNHAREVWQ